MRDLDRLPIVLKNVRATRSWRPRDMLNWHRMVAPLRTLPRANPEPAFDFYHLLYDMCTRFEVRYVPAASGRAGVEDTSAPSKGRRVVLFVDAPDHTSGVATTLQQWADMAERRGVDLTICYCSTERIFRRGVRFEPAGTLHMGVYQGLPLHMPSVTDVMKYSAQRPADVIHLSTPGPMGLLGLLVAHRQGCAACGTYHTDFPAYISRWTGDTHLEHAAWRYMRWFYGQLARVATPSRETMRKLARHGFDANRLAVVGRGVCAELFSPQHRDHALRRQWGGMSCWLLYVGRVSREKNLECLVEAYRLLVRRRPDVGLVVTGEGPYLDEMKQALAGYPVVFTGLQKGDELSRIYASADLFVFPSRTDTLGVVLLEAQASGLPVLVSGDGGPKDCMKHDVTGRIVEPMNAALLYRAMDDLIAHPAQRKAMGEAARRHALAHTPERAFDAFWNLHALAASRRSKNPEVRV